MLTVAQHRQLAKKIEQKDWKCLHSSEKYFNPDGWSVISNVQQDKLLFGHMMRNRLNNEPVKVLQEADVVLSDENTEGNVRTNNVNQKMAVV